MGNVNSHARVHASIEQPPGNRLQRLAHMQATIRGLQALRPPSIQESYSIDELISASRVITLAGRVTVADDIQ